MRRPFEWRGWIAVLPVLVVCGGCGGSCGVKCPAPNGRSCAPVDGKVARIELGGDRGAGFEPWTFDDTRGYSCRPPDSLGLCHDYLSVRLRVDGTAPACL